MKVLAFILSFIILGLSCLPCSDAKLFANKDASPSIEMVKSHSDQHSSHRDLCNPFCSCACCGTTPVSQKAPSITLELPNYITSYQDSYSSSFVTSVTLPIWQPPQLIA